MNLDFSQAKQMNEQATSDKVLICLKGIGLIYKTRNYSFEALHDINLSMSKGEFVAVIGSSGCGKTSLLRVMAGYERPSHGSITISDIPHFKANADVGVVFQQPNLFPYLTIEQNVEFGLKMKGVPRLERKELVRYYLDMVGLSHVAKRLPYQLSGGMKQRGAIARALATDPKVILMDEPFSALDALTRESMEISLYHIWRQTQKCILFITHDIEEALLLSTRVLIMQPSPGRIVKDLRNFFAYQLDEQLPTQLRSSNEFIKMRESLMSEIKKS
jgi:taurine transport system ATP-binding protein